MDTKIESKRQSILMNEKEFFKCIIMAILLQRGDFNLVHQNDIAEKLYH